MSPSFEDDACGMNPGWASTIAATELCPFNQFYKREILAVQYGKIDTWKCMNRRPYGMLPIVARNAGCEFDDRLAAVSRRRLRGSFANRNFGFRVRDAMHDLERAAKQLTIALKGINDVCGHRKFGSAADDIEPLGLEVGQYDPLGEIAGATILQYVQQSQPADIRG